MPRRKFELAVDDVGKPLGTGRPWLSKFLNVAAFDDSQREGATAEDLDEDVAGAAAERLEADGEAASPSSSLAGPEVTPVEKAHT